MNNNRKVLLAGATGYLGGFILEELCKREIYARTIARSNSNKIKQLQRKSEVVEADVTNPEQLSEVCEGIDTVISTIGITRQKDGKTYMDVDFQANKNLLEVARSAGVRKFIYVSVLNGNELRNLKICDAKEKFVDELKSSEIEFCIVRPNGFFSDMKDFLKMAKSGKVYLFGDGEYKLNPIHGADLAKICVDTIESKEEEINIGGPDILTQNEIAALALKALDKKVKIAHLPDWIRRFILSLMRGLTSQKTYGPYEFFLTTLAMDMVAPTYGNHKLSNFFEKHSGEYQ